MSAQEKTYLGVPLSRPRVGFFDFTGCEGCQLQMLNNEATLLDFLSLVEIVRFREAMTGGTDDYQIAFIEGSITRQDEIERVRAIRSNAATLVALGTCAVFGGVNQLRNRFSIEDVTRTVYGDHPIETLTAQPVSTYVSVDLAIPGCPVRKEEVERLVLNLVLGKSLELPRYPVCHECKAHQNICLYDLGEVCLGPVTRAGCEAWCPSSAMGCWGCRGPVDDANITELRETCRKRGISQESLNDRLACFGGFPDVSQCAEQQG